MLLEVEVERYMETGGVIGVAKAGQLVSELRHSLHYRRPLPGFVSWNDDKLREGFSKPAFPGRLQHPSIAEIKKVIRATLSRCLDEYKLFHSR
jgi:hypothetical protein